MLDILASASSWLAGWREVARASGVAQLELWPKISISWTLVIVLAAMCLILLKQVAGIRARLEHAISEPRGPQIWLNLAGKSLGSRDLIVRNIAGGTAHNIWLEEMSDGMHRSESSRVVPLLSVGSYEVLDLKARLIDKDASGMTISADAFLSKLHRPIIGTVHHEDANGKRFVTRFSIEPDADGTEVEFKRTSRRLLL